MGRPYLGKVERVRVPDRQVELLQAIADDFDLPKAEVHRAALRLALDGDNGQELRYKLQEAAAARALGAQTEDGAA